MSKQRNFDRSKLVIPQGTMEDFRRPNHADFKTTSELAKEEFTGYRKNSVTGRLEIWMLGNIEKELSDIDFQFNKYALQDAMEQVFGLKSDKEN